ncbi:MAG TPA: hypothetical protein PLK90_08990 [Clostridiales bacterium]|nr:hypothetical protein [Clostridiales bacterium]HQP70520.1 hypothetical protein [Clostridiales bacterium]
MKKITSLIFLSAAVLFYVHSFELGIVLGEPTGLSSRFIAGNNLIDVHLGTGYAGGFSLHGAYLFHTKSGIVIEGQNLPFYYGPRLAVSEGHDDRWHDEDSKLGIYFDLGLNYMFRQNPFNLFVELAPGLRLGGDDIDVDFCGGIGFRYVFGKTSSGSGSNGKKEKPKGVDVNW